MNADCVGSNSLSRATATGTRNARFAKPARMTKMKNRTYCLKARPTYKKILLTKSENYYVPIKR